MAEQNPVAENQAGNLLQATYRHLGLGARGWDGHIEAANRLEHNRVIEPAGLLAGVLACSAVAEVATGEIGLLLPMITSAGVGFATAVREGALLYHRVMARFQSPEFPTDI